jgi:ornithine carbamoyltransferase
MIAKFRDWIASGTKLMYSEWAQEQVRSDADVHVMSQVAQGDDPYAKVKNADLIGAACHSVHTAVLQASIDGKFALTIGGDHSIASGSISALLESYPDLAVVWVDAHADANTPETSPSNHYHGMPAAHVMGWFKRGVLGFEWLRTVLPEARLAYIGLRDIDPEEGRLLRESCVHVYTIHDVMKLGIGQVVASALNKVDPHGKSPLHLSFDVDSLDPCDAPGTGTLARGGLSFREAQYICTEMAFSNRLVGMDLVEVNPLLDVQLDVMHGDDADLAPTTKTTHVALQLILAALGKSCLHQPIEPRQFGAKFSAPRAFSRQLTGDSRNSNMTRTASETPSPQCSDGSDDDCMRSGSPQSTPSIGAASKSALDELTKFLPPYVAKQALNAICPSLQVTKPAYQGVPSLAGRSLLSIKDLSRDELSGLLDLAIRMKQVYKQKTCKFQPLLGKSMAMIFQKRSTRTRVSTETGMAMLGGHALFLGPDDIQLGTNESMKDTARVLSVFNSIVLARVYSHSHVVELANESSIPVINGLSDLHHPLQTLADLQTLQEHFGHLSGLTVSWVGDGNNVLHDLILGCAKLGIHLQIATPSGYEPNAAILAETVELAAIGGTRVEISTDPKKAVMGADAVFTDTWISMGEESLKMQKLANFAGFQVTRQLMSLANPDAVFMHCLPRKAEEVTDEIFYSPCSLVFKEAENRMWTVMATMLSQLGH